MRNRQHDFLLMVLIAVLSLAAVSQVHAGTFSKPTDPVENSSSVASGIIQKNSDQPEKSSADTPKKEEQPSESAQEKTNNKSASGDSEEVNTSAESSAEESKTNSEEVSNWNDIIYPLLVLMIGIGTVLGMIIVLKINAFLALITSAIIVSILSPGGMSGKIGRVADALGDAVGGIGIVIALAAIIGKCMLDSGAADRIVRAFMDLLGEKRAPVALMGSGFVLAIPVFFDTVFYLLVPLARSLHRKTGVRYLFYIMAIGAGGAITHTLVPPTPGPLLMAANLGIDFGTMILIGALVALPAAFAGLMCGSIADRIMQTPMRELPGSPEPEPIKDEDLPSLWISLAPVIIPVILISLATIVTTIADRQHAAQFKLKDIDKSFPSVVQTVDDAPASRVAKRIVNHPAMAESTIAAQLPKMKSVMTGLNQLIRDKSFYDEDVFLGVKLNPTVKKLLNSNRERMKLGEVERLNRSLIESAFPNLIEEHQWDTSSRQLANVFGFFGNPNFALLISTMIALWTLARQRNLSFADLAKSTEEALMSGGVIILITAGGGAFGAMLKVAEVGEAIKLMFSGSGSEGMSGMGFLFLGFGIAAILKIAQGSSTVAMIVGSSMIAAIVGGMDIGFNYVYLATAIGAGSLFGSWMNDSGFWIFAKMGGLTEGEALKSWTVMLIVLSLVSFLVTILLALVLPMNAV